ncbi:MAG: hypothetical protein JSS98_11025 [Bacteroidetes bacterium]|nr:hypothetical protein [Bacteroidota bacterium]
MGFKNNAPILFSFRSTIAKPTIVFSIWHTQPLPLTALDPSQLLSVTTSGFDSLFSVKEFHTI